MLDVKWPLVVSAVLIALTAAGLQASVSIDLSDDFPTVQGADGLYAQAYDPESGAYRLLDDMVDSAGRHFFGTPGQAWGIAKLQAIPDQVLMCPSVNRPLTEWAVLMYSAEEEGQYRTQGSFVSKKSATDARVLVYCNNASGLPLWESALVGAAGVASFDISVYLNLGDQLRFAVDAGETDPDSAYLSGTVITLGTAEVPEPGCLAALLTGMVGLAALRRGKR